MVKALNGPWNFVDDGSKFIQVFAVIDGKQIPVCTVGGFGSCLTSEQIKLNACLIRSAPGLLDCAEAFSVFLGMFESGALSAFIDTNDPKMFSFISSIKKARRDLTLELARARGYER